MRNRLLFSFALMVLCFMSVTSQTLSVESFRPLEHDLTALQASTEKKDFNGESSALIKVVNSNTGFSFEGGVMGIVATRQEVGEIWVYVPHGIQRITIKHPTLGVLRDYYFPCSIEAARTYELKLTSGQVITTVVQDLGGQYLTMQVTPANAVVYIDDLLQSTNSDGTLSLFLARGHHTYRVEASSHINSAGAFEIGTKKERLNVVLESALATLTVSLDDQSSEVYVNDQKKGKGNWSGKLVSGIYVVEARRAGYRSVRQSVELGTQEQKTISLTGLTPMYGILQISSEPIDANVYIDGKLLGTSPDIFKNIFAGSHELKVSKTGYKEVLKTIKVEENKILKEQITLAKGLDTGGEAKETTGEYIDLGLSVKWASCNVGASSPEEYGNYYNWKAACKFNLPTEAQMEELKSKCTWKFTTLNGVKGVKVTGPNGNNIFMPCAGWRVGSTLHLQNYYGRYWSSTPYPHESGNTVCLSFSYDGNSYVVYDPVDNDISVRAVAGGEARESPIVATGGEAKETTGEYIDLGLSVKWASCNVGASSPEEYGNYYNWKAACKFNLPTKAQMEELKSKCTWEVTTLNEVKGVKVIGPNGNSIFMPCAGWCYDSDLRSHGNFGDYWSSTPISNDDYHAYYLYFNSYGKSSVCNDDNNVSFEFSVRTVAGGESKESPIAATGGESKVTTGEYIDLGLSVKWASCNVGASSPEEYGNYYNWKAACKFNLPTKAQMEELKSKCTWEIITLNGVKGMKVTGPNGNSIFMPCAGCRLDSALEAQGFYGFCWSSTHSPSNDGNAYYLGFGVYGDRNVDDGGYVDSEFSVRTVAEK